MKKTLWIVIAGALVASVIAASAQSEVLSANAVGYIKREINSGGKFQTFTVPLYSMSGSVLFTNTSVAQEAPVGTAVYFWDPTFNGGAGGWDSVTRGTFTGWGKFNTKTLASGEGFMLKSPTNSTQNLQLTITGEVPDEDGLSATIRPGLNLAMIGNPFPVDVTFGTTALASNAAVGSIVAFWDPTLSSGRGGWRSTTRGTFSGWGNAATNVVKAGEAFAFREAGTTNSWSVNRPYTWPDATP
jgi:hypothetical protein